MAASSYDECLRRLLVHEGGYSDHPADPGGPTKFGITIADYRRYVKPSATAADVKAMPVEVAQEIYRTKYWAALRCDELPAGVDDSVFDYGVHSGTERSGKVLRRVLGLPDTTSAVDETVLRALATRDPGAVIAAINDERLRFLQSLSTWDVFGAGWRRRVEEVRAFSLALAASDSVAIPEPERAGTPSKGTVSQRKLPSAAARAGAAGAVVGAAAAHSAGVSPLVIALLVATGIFAAIGALVLRERWRLVRQDAPTPAPIPVPREGGQAQPGGHQPAAH